MTYKQSDSTQQPRGMYGCCRGGFSLMTQPRKRQKRREENPFHKENRRGRTCVRFVFAFAVCHFAPFSIGASENPKTRGVNRPLAQSVGCHVRLVKILTAYCILCESFCVLEHDSRSTRRNQDRTQACMQPNRDAQNRTRTVQKEEG